MSNNKDFKVKNGIQPTVYHEAVGTVVSVAEGYALSEATYDSVSFSVLGQDTDPYGLFFKPDGTVMYVAGDAGNDINQYSLSSAWDISTASFVQNFSVSGQESAPSGVLFKPDGTKMYVVGTATDTVYQYSISTAWDISTANYDSVSFSVGSQDTFPLDLSFKPDGTKMFIVGKTGDSVYEYDLSTAWVVSSASFSESFSVASQETGPQGLFISPTGVDLFIVGAASASVNYYTLSTPWEISTATHTGFFSVSAQEADPQALYFKTDGTKMFILGSSTDTIYQYSTALNTAELDLSSGSVFDYTPTSDVQVTLTNPAASGTSSGATLLISGGGTTGYDLANASYSGKSFSVASQDTTPLGLSFNNTGTKLYVAGAANDSIFQYSLSTAYDISTSSYDSISFNVSGQASAPQAVSFKSDGTKMYVLDDTPNNSVHQYSLGTAFDLSTASYDSVSFSVAAQEGGPLGLFIKPDGTKFYVCGTGSDTVFQYSMSTAWDMSTASYDSVSFSVASQDSRPNGIFFNPTGDKMFISGQGSDTILEYALSTSWNVSTASYTGTSLDVSTEALNPQDLVMSSDGKVLFVITSETDSIYQYNSATPASITYDSTLQWSGGTAPTSPAIGETDVITFNTTDGGTTYKSVLAIDGAK